MKKYKLIKKYPSIPEDWVVGSEVIEYSLDERYFTKDGNSEIPYIFRDHVTNYPEFWEEVIEKDYEIIEIRRYGDWYAEGYVASTLRQNGLFINDTAELLNGMYKVEDCLKEGWVIWKVKRLSDGEVFEVGQEVMVGPESNTKGKIVSFKEVSDYLEVLSSMFRGSLNYIKPIKTKTWYFLNKITFVTWEEEYQQVSKPLTAEAALAFETEEKRTNYISEFKPLFNRREIIDFGNFCQSNEDKPVGVIFKDWFKLIS